MRGSKFVKLSSATVSLLAIIASAPSLAQSTTPEATPVEGDAVQANDPAATESNEIVVTGSRIARPELESPVPVAVVGAQEILQDAAQNVSDTLNELPQVAIGSTRTNSNFLTSGTGIATVNLRSLGSSRTLVLVNGRRFIGGFAGDSSVDLNNIPTDFVQRVEVITGGSSAVYGSDAVAGVVNFILKDRFEGLQLRTQAGITEEGDNPRYYASLTGGTSWGADDRGTAILNFSWDKDKGLASRDRAISSQDCSFTVCGPASYSSYAPQGRFQLLSPGGAARAVLPGGNSLFTFDRSDNSLVLGFPAGFGFNRNAIRLISTPVERYLGSGVFNYELSSKIKAFAEVTYSKVTSDSDIEPLALDAADIFFREEDPFGIPITNPFIPAQVQAAIAAANSDANPNNNVDSIGFRRRQNEIFDRSNIAERNTWRVAAGFEGDLADRFNWEASYVYGHLNDFNASEDIDNNRYRNALDAIRTGPGNVVGTDIVCRSASARAEGCIPINLFGLGTADPRAASYVQAVVPKSEEITNEQHVVTASISGPLFTWWGGDVRAAVGGEYRKESAVDDLDILTNTGGNSGNLIPDFEGGFDVWEAFGEVLVPVLRDLPFAKSFNLLGAARYSDYSTIGGVFSWNAGAEWEPFDGLRFRGMYAVANRAPNIGELFTQPSETFASINDPCNGVEASTSLSENEFANACRAIPGVAAAIAANGVFEYTLADLQTINGFVGGNRDLQEETAKTLTLGAVFTPRFIPGLTLTADYYDIKIDGAIATLGRNRSVEECLLTSLDVYCTNVIRSANTGFIQTVNGQLINVAGLKNKGVDVGMRYTRALNLLPEDALSLAVNYTYLIDNITQGDPSEDPEDDAGTFGQAYSKHRFLARANYTIGAVTLGWTTNFMSGGPFLRDFESGDDATDALNEINDYWLHDAQVRVEANDKFTFYFNVDNVFDKKPQYLPGTPFGTPTGLETTDSFDLFGRRFTAGAVVRF